MDQLDELRVMSTNEINQLVAEKVMGWSLGEYTSWVDRRTDELVHYHKSTWNPSTDHNDAASVRAEIERRGLPEKFLRSLENVTCGNTYDLWSMANATPRETCIAAILAVEGVK